MVHSLTHTFRMTTRLVVDNKLCKRQVTFKIAADDQPSSSLSAETPSQVTTIYYIPSATEQEIAEVEKAAHRSFMSLSQRRALKSKVGFSCI